MSIKKSLRKFKARVALFEVRKLQKIHNSYADFRMSALQRSDFKEANNCWKWMMYCRKQIFKLMDAYPDYLRWVV